MRICLFRSNPLQRAASETESEQEEQEVKHQGDGNKDNDGDPNRRNVAKKNVKALACNPDLDTYAGM